MEGSIAGRYETGDLNQDLAKVVRMNSKISNINWYKMYLKCKELKGIHENIDTNMIWGIQYDETLKWLIDSKSKSYSDMMADTSTTSVDNAGKWGNYYNVSFSYYDANGNLNPTQKTGSTKLPSGAADRNMGNNVYDLAGNVWDWTMESDGSVVRYCRGGSYNGISIVASNVPSYRGSNYPDSSISSCGCRVVLYIR